MTKNYERCKKSILRYKEKNADKIKAHNQYLKDLTEFMNILLDEKIETYSQIYYDKHKEIILANKKEYYQKNKEIKKEYYQKKKQEKLLKDLGN